MRGHGNAVVHPLSVPANRNHPSPTQIRQMPRNLGLRTAKSLDEIADADFLVADQVQDPESRLIPERLKEPLQVELGFLGHVYIFALTNPSVKNIFLLADMICQGGVDVRTVAGFGEGEIWRDRW